MKARRDISEWSPWQSVNDGYAMFGAHAHRRGKSYLVYFTAIATSIVAKRNKIPEHKTLDFMSMPHVGLDHDVHFLIEVNFDGPVLQKQRKRCRCKLYVGPRGSFVRPQHQEGRAIVTHCVQRSDLGVLMEEHVDKLRFATKGNRSSYKSIHE